MKWINNFLETKEKKLLNISPLNKGFILKYVKIDTKTVVECLQEEDKYATIKEGLKNNQEKFGINILI